MGLSRAGFTVMGIDHKPQPRYPFHFIEGDWTMVREIVKAFDFQFIWASPPCQRYMKSGLVNKKGRPDLIGPVRDVLLSIGIPFVMENVPGAPLRKDLMLCGSHVGLPIRRHRIFEIHGFIAPQQPVCDHSNPVIGIYGNPQGKAGAWKTMLPGTVDSWKKAMDMPWAIHQEISQAIPPPYSEYIAKEFISQQKGKP